MVKSRDQGRFWGYRIDWEYVPCLPARVVADYLADPRRVPYLLIWRYRGLPIERALKAPNLGQMREVVRLAPYSLREGEAPSPGWVEVKRWNGVRVGLRVLERPLPRHGGKCLLLMCNRCQQPRRALYGWQAVKAAWAVKFADWLCLRCAGLSYASEGGALIFRSRWAPARPFSGLLLKARPERWEPIVFTSPLKTIESGLVQNVFLHHTLV